MRTWPLSTWKIGSTAATSGTPIHTTTGFVPRQTARGPLAGSHNRDSDENAVYDATEPRAAAMVLTPGVVRRCVTVQAIGTLRGTAQVNDLGIIFGCAVGFIGWFVIRYVVTGFFTVDQNERAVKTRSDGPNALVLRPRSTTPSPSPSMRRSASGIVIRRFASSPPAARTSSGPGKKFTRFTSPRRR